MSANLKALCCACVFFFSINVMAAGNTQAGGAVQNEKSNASAVKGAEKVIGGVITAINAEKKEFSVSRNNEQYPIQVIGSAQIVSGKDPIDFSNLVVGDKVTVHYTKLSNGIRNAVNIEKKSSGSTAQSSGTPTQPASVHAKHKTHEKAVSTKAEAPAAPKAEAPAAPKTEVKAEPKKAEAPAAAPAAPKTEVKAEPKKAEAPAAPVAPKAEVKAEPKKAETPAATPTKIETKTEIKTETKTETKTIPK